MRLGSWVCSGWLMPPDVSAAQRGGSPSQPQRQPYCRAALPLQMFSSAKGTKTGKREHQRFLCSPIAESHVCEVTQAAGEGAPWCPALLVALVQAEHHPPGSPTWVLTVCAQLGGCARVFVRVYLSLLETGSTTSAARPQAPFDSCFLCQAVCRAGMGPAEPRAEPTTRAGTHADQQHRAHFKHGVAVGALTDVGIVCTWVVKAQLHGHVLAEGFHPGRASPNTHKLQTENRTPISTGTASHLYSRGPQSAPRQRRQHLLELARNAGPFPGPPASGKPVMCALRSPPVILTLPRVYEALVHGHTAQCKRPQQCRAISCTQGRTTTPSPSPGRKAQAPRLPGLRASCAQQPTALERACVWNKMLRAPQCATRAPQPICNMGF